MSDECANCGEEIRQGGILKEPNWRLSQQQVELVNFMSGTDHTELCVKCGQRDFDQIREDLQMELHKLQRNQKANSQAFPIFTTDRLPDQSKYQLIGMVTANVSIGTGIFNEFSQGLSDLFGATNTDTGMAFKVNSGEETARTILAQKALALGANCVVAVDIDYGTTVNNAATVNMQGTAAVVDDLEHILEDRALKRATKYLSTHRRIKEIGSWLAGNLAVVESTSDDPQT